MTQARRPGTLRKPGLEPLVFGIHATIDANRDWGDVLALLREHVDAQLATLSRHQFASGIGLIICESPPSPAFRKAYAEYSLRNPWFLSSEHYVTGRVITGNELLSNKDLVKTDFYRNLLKPLGLLHCMSGVAIRRGDLIYSVSVHRGADRAGFGEREKSCLRAVLPHMSLALENGWRLREARELGDVLAGVIDRLPHRSILVDAGGRVVHRSVAIAHALPGTGLAIEDGHLATATIVDRSALREAIRDVAEASVRGDRDITRTVALSVPGAHQPAVASIHAAGRFFDAQTGDVVDAVLVKSRNPQVEHDIQSCSLVRQFGLSPAQARVSVMIIGGHSLVDTARKLHVSENTARSHLKQVFQKTNTHGQMELVHLHTRSCVDSD